MKLAMTALTLATALFACTGSGGDAPKPVADRAADRAAVAPARVGPSIYPLGVELVDQNGATIGLDRFRGHPTVISMFYGSCPVACPVIMMHIARVEEALPPSVRKDTRVLLVSFDPERDTPAALREIAASHHADPARWLFATGPEESVRPLAGALGISYRKLPGGAITHDSVITVLDRDGSILARHDDPTAELAPLVTALEQAALRK